MRILGILTLALVGCSSDNNSSPDAAAQGDAAIRPDGSSVTLDAPRGQDSPITALDAPALGPDADVFFSANNCTLTVMGDPTSGVTTTTFNVSGAPTTETLPNGDLHFTAAVGEYAARPMNTQVACVDQETTRDDAGVPGVVNAIQITVAFTGKYFETATFPLRVNQSSPGVAAEAFYQPNATDLWNCTMGDLLVASAVQLGMDATGNIAYLIHGNATATCPSVIGNAQGVVTIALSF